MEHKKERLYASKTTYNEKYKMWVTVRCPLEDDEQSLKDKKEIEEMVKSMFINQYLKRNSQDNEG